MGLKLNEMMLQMSGRSSTNGSVVGLLVEPKQTLDVWDGFEVDFTFKNSSNSIQGLPKTLFPKAFCEILGL